MTTKEQIEQHGIEIVHHFVGGSLYAKEMRVPAGLTIGKHTHSFDHLSALMAGSVEVCVDGVKQAYTAPALITICANKVHEIEAITDVVWACIHATDETDPDRIDHVLTGEAVCQ